MTRPGVELADILRRFGPGYRATHRLPVQQHRVMRAIEQCRTPALGGHVEHCDRCDFERISYNSCRNRHCPKCQNTARAEWVEARMAELLPTHYFHVVFTIPAQFNAVALQNKACIYKLLFDASAETLLTIAADPRHLGARIGFFSILHTWGQNLLDHPHIHSVVPGGGLSPDGGSWVACGPGFFLPVKVLSRRFRRLFTEGLHQLFAEGALDFRGALEPLAARFPALVDEMAHREWVVYAKPPFAGPAQVIDYVGRYTHRVALSNDRIVSVEGSRVTFAYKDYRDRDRFRPRRMTLGAEEFIRRFLLHTLPPGFARIRHYGLLAGRNKKRMLPLCRKLLEPPGSCLPQPQEINAYKTAVLPPAGFPCPVCARGQMVRVSSIFRIRPVPPLDSS
jgi:hypothetical protein